MPKITKIEKIVPQIAKKKKVAAYARVSMETELLLHSLSTQVSYYSSLIQNNPEWEYVGVYADEAVTGTSTKLRGEFNRLIADCDAGKIDLILVKSISRFARNTVDLLNTIRHLKEIGVEVRFEREGISTFTGDGELLLTLLASFAQEESRSISENIKWSIRKRFEQGIPNGHKAPFGYEWDGEMFRIVPEQGKVVKTIYERYLAGESAHAIARSLAKKGVVGQMGKPIEESTVKNILSSISYTGTMILQKNYYSEEHRRRKNKGELPRYAVEEMFEPLISVEDFEKVQKRMEQRAAAMPNKNPILTAFSGIVICGNCGSPVSRRTTPKGKKWVCNRRERKGRNVCEMRPIYENELEYAARKVLGLSDYDENTVKKKVALITVYGDHMEFLLKNGQCKKVIRQYGGYKMRGAFSGKIKCGRCGHRCERDTWQFGPAKQKVSTKVWVCKNACGLHRVLEQELQRAAKEFLGKDYEPKFVEEVDYVEVDNDRLTFMLKDGTVKQWQRE